MWIKSSYSAECNNCVEIDLDSEPGIVKVRDSKLGDESSILRFTYNEWLAFINGVANGELTI